MEHLLFACKKVLTLLLMPLGAWLILTCVGALLRLCNPRSRIGMGVMVAGGIWLVVCSTGLVGFALMRSLENEAGPYADPTELERQGVQLIVVLGGGLREGESLTTADRLGNSIQRIMEGLRLWRGIPGATLVTSGGSVSGKMTAAEVMASFAIEMGVLPDAVRIERASLDTEDEARLLAPLLKGRKFALVTSAFHMPRSLLQFRRYGLTPIPAPAEFQSRRHPEWYPIFPPVRGFSVNDRLGPTRILGESLDFAKD